MGCDLPAPTLAQFLCTIQSEVSYHMSEVHDGCKAWLEFKLIAFLLLT